MSDEQLQPLIQRLKSIADVSEKTASALSGLPCQTITLDQGEAIYQPDGEKLSCYVLLEGCVIRYKPGLDGRRTIVSFELAGDIVNYDSLLLGRTDCGAETVTSCRFAVIERGVMAQALVADHRLEVTLWRYALVKAAIFEEWLLNVGRRSPTARLAHLFLELQVRLTVVGASAEVAARSYASHEILADAMGLQLVIATRCIHELASTGAIELSEDSITIRNAAKLAEIGHFRPDFLHLTS